MDFPYYAELESTLKCHPVCLTIGYVLVLMVWKFACLRDDPKSQCWVELELNSPVNTVKVMSSQSVHLLTFSWGGFVPLAVNQYFVHMLAPVTDNCPSCLFVWFGLNVAFNLFQSYRDGVWMWQGAQCSLPLLYQQKGKNGRRNYFMINLHQSNVAKLRFKLVSYDLCICSWWCYPSH